MVADAELDDASDAEGGLGFLKVDAFIRDLVSARVLKTALELQVVDLLEAHGPTAGQTLAETVGAEPRAFAILLELLIGCGVAREDEGRVELTPAFREVLPYRDLLEAKLDFAGFVTADFMELFSALVTDPGSFQARSRLFHLFDYEKARVPTPENLRHTRIWVDFTTALSRYEAGVCLHHHDFSSVRRMLDVGGNSGEFALRLCRANPSLEATVFDLPVVCEIGQAHVLPHEERARVRFHAGSALHDAWPTGFDLIS